MYCSCLSRSCSASFNSLTTHIHTIKSEKVKNYRRKLTRKQSRGPWVQGCAMVSAQFTINYSSVYLIACTCRLSLKKLQVQFFDLLVFEPWYKVHFNNPFKAFITTRFFIGRSVKNMCKTKRIHWQTENGRNIVHTTSCTVRPFSETNNTDDHALSSLCTDVYVFAKSYFSSSTR